jgi:RNA polymerase sigma-70 factor (ECF subfamily)
LLRVKSRQAEAWQRLVQLYGPLVYQWCRRSSLQADDAADVGQEVFVAVANSITGFRRDRPGDSFRGWLWQITRNKICDHFRQLKDHAQAEGGSAAQRRFAEIADELPEVVPEADSGSDAPLQQRALEVVQSTVEKHTWKAFWRFTIDGQTAAQVAEELGMSVPAVYVANHRVRRKLREELRELME